MRVDDVDLSCQGCMMREQPQIADGSFLVRVPVVVDERSLWATLRCRVTEAGHEIELEMLTDDGGAALSPSDEESAKVLRAVERLADLRLCGNERLCPEQVIRMVRAEA